MQALELLPQLITLSNRLNQLEFQLFKGHSRAQTELLLLLQQQGPQTVSALASQRSVKLATMSQQVLEMTQLKLVFLARSKKDKRVKLVVLTDKGKQQLVNIEQLLVTQKATLSASLMTIAPLLSQLRENLSND